MRVTVLVRPKAGILDPQGDAVGGSLRHLGFAVGEVHVGRVIDVDLDTSDVTEARAAAEQMCDQLLANSLVESYEIEISEASA